MEIELEAVQELAPDQASLNAAQKLLKPAKWPVRGFSREVSAVWGQCQGSGSKPYFTMADPVDHGYKCTCPSRKFPCKHVLALLWQFSEAAGDFAESEHPEWVQDWLSRRRKSTAQSDRDTDTDKPKNEKSIRRAIAGEDTALSEEEQRKRTEASARRAEKNRAATRKMVSSVLEEFSQWIDDQLRTGVAHLTRDITSRCRQIAARLVDGKAAALAARMDELPARALHLEGEAQLEFVLRELGQLVLLCRAWQADPEDPDTRRGVIGAENRDQLLEADGAQRIGGTWLVAGERVESRRDGLVAQSTWLLNTGEVQPRVALLQDYFPASAGRRGVTPAVGRQLEGEVVFYPSRAPLRAILSNFRELEGNALLPWPAFPENPLSPWHRGLAGVPWLEQAPCPLGPGRVCVDARGHYWWQQRGGTLALPLANQSLPPLLTGAELGAAFAVWNGCEADLLCANTADWGTVSC